MFHFHASNPGAHGGEEHTQARASLAPLPLTLFYPSMSIRSANAPLSTETDLEKLDRSIRRITPYSQSFVFALLDRSRAYQPWKDPYSGSGKGQGTA